MQVRADQLPGLLQRSLKPLYLVYGDEPLLTQEAGDLIRATARSAGFEERKVFNVSGAHFDWSGLIGASLVQAMIKAQASGDLEAAQVTAAECVVLAETKDHANWELLGMLGRSLSGDLAEALIAACDEVEDEEDEHLYHTQGWARELALKGLGLPAVLPPPEEEQHVESAIAAAKAKKQRKAELPQG